jgi:hypothetical protein
MPRASRDWQDDSNVIGGDLVRHTQRNATVAFRYCRVEIKKGTIAAREIFGNHR